MQCINCGKEGANLRLRNKCYGKGDDLLIIKGVPIISCRNCAQDYLTAETAHMIDAILLDKGKFEKHLFEVTDFTAA